MHLLYLTFCDNLLLYREAIHLFSETLRALRKERGLTQVQFARQFSVATGTIAMWETGKREPDFSTMERLADFFEVSVDFLLGRAGSADGRSPRAYSTDSERGRNLIPILGRVQAGVPVEAVEDFLGYEEYSGRGGNADGYFALEVRGESMEPKISSGDVVIVRKQDDCDNGDLAVVLVSGEDATVKRIKKSAAGIMLIPNNPAFEPMFFSNEEIEALPVTILGKVVELRAKF